MKTNTYHKPGKNKQIARDKMVEAIADSNTSYGTILSLPNTSWLIEEQVMSEVSNRFKFLGVECHGPTFDKMVTCMLENKWRFQTHFGKLSEIILASKPNAFSHIIADYCGQLHKQAKELRYALQNNLVEVDGTIAITLNKRIAMGQALKFEKQTIKGYGKRPKAKNRCAWQLECFVSEFGNYEIEEVFEYKDAKKKSDGRSGANMILMIVRRVK